MAFANPTVPNLPDFIIYAQAQGIAPDALPATSDYYAWALTQAVDMTIHFSSIPPILYVMAVYNYGVNWLINWAQDQSGLVLTALSWSNGLVTATTSLPLGDAIGQTLGITMSGAVPAGYNGTFTATNAGANSFTYPLAANPGTATSPGVFGTTFFANARTSFNILSFTAGPVSSSFDQGTGQSLVVPEWLTNATLSTLGLLKTPWGRAYLEYEQAYGPTVVGVS